MMNMGRSAAEAAQFYELSRSSHRLTVHVHLLDNQMRFIQDISWMLIEGSVDMDSTASITRSCKLVLVDPLNSLGITPGQGTTFFHRMIRVYRTIQSIERPEISFTNPVFTGPVTGFSRNGIKSNIECQGKEVLLRQPSATPWTWPAAWPKLWVIDNIMRIWAGELNFDYSGTWRQDTLGADWSIEPGENLFGRVRDLARSMNCQAYYDAWGIFHLRARPQGAVWSFTDGDFTSPPSVEYNVDDLCNLVVVTGGGLAGWEGKYSYSAALPVEHPYSAQSLSIDGITPRWMPYVYSDDSLSSLDQCVESAWSTLLERLLMIIDVNFTSVIYPHLEEGDVYNIYSSTYNGQGAITKWSIPLVGDGDMSVGFLSTSSVSDGYSIRGEGRTLSVATVKAIPVKAVDNPIKAVAGTGINGSIVITKEKPKQNKKNKDNSKGKDKNNNQRGKK